MRIVRSGAKDRMKKKNRKINFNLNSLDARYVARYAIDKMFKNKLIIIPGATMKLGIFFSRFVPTKMLLRIAYNIQKRKKEKKGL